MGIYFNPAVDNSHALSPKDSLQYWQLASEAAGLRTDPPAGEAILIRSVRVDNRPRRTARNFLPELACALPSGC